MTQRTAEQLTSGVTGSWFEGRHRSTRSPAPGAEKITPVTDRKIRKALRRELRVIYLHLQYRLALLKLRQFDLKDASVVLQVIHELTRGLLELVSERHGRDIIMATAE